MRMRWTDEMVDWMRENVPGRDKAESYIEFCKIFPCTCTLACFKRTCSRLGIMSGYAHVGQHGFPKGVVHEDRSRYKFGDVAECADGQKRRVRIKTEDGWETYSRWVWEKHYGKIPENCCVMFINKDQTDCRIENLALVEKRYVRTVGNMKIRCETREQFEILMEVAEVKRLCNEMKRKGLLRESK